MLKFIKDKNIQCKNSFCIIDFAKAYSEIFNGSKVRFCFYITPKQYLDIQERRTCTLNDKYNTFRYLFNQIHYFTFKHPSKIEAKFEDIKSALKEFDI
jgi:hypothetical protein